jgi:phage portal protein BeeE
MFGWFGGSKLRQENERLQREVETLKAASPGTPPQLTAEHGGPTIQEQVNLGAAREQLAHFRGWAFIAVSAIAKRIAGQAVKVGYTPAPPDKPEFMTKGMTNPAGEAIDYLDSHPLLEAINDPNDFLIRWSLIYVTVCQLNLAGIAYWWLDDHAGKLQIYPLPADWVRPEPERKEYYRVRPPGNPEGFLVHTDDLAQFLLPSPANPWMPASPLAAQSAAVNLSEEIDRSHIATMRNAAKPGMVIRIGRFQPTIGSGTPAGSMPRYELTEEQRAQLVGAVRKMFAGSENHGRVLILDSLVEEAEQFSNAGSDLEYKDGTEITQSRIMQTFGVHPFAVGATAPSSYAQAAAVENVFVGNVINPLLTLLGETLTAWVAARFKGPKGERLVVKFEPAVARDADLEFKKMNLLASKQAVTLNELRAFANLPPVDGGDELLGDAGPHDVIAAKAILAARDPYSPPAKINGQSQNRIVGKTA